MSKSTVTANVQTASSSPVLMLAFELGEESWLLGFYRDPERNRRLICEQQNGSMAEDLRRSYSAGPPPEGS